MPLQFLFRFLANLISLAILIAAGYLLWSWWDGDLVRQTDGTIVRVREDWLLWVGLAGLAFSFLGRPLMVLLLAGADKDRTAPVRGNGTTIEAPNGAQLYVEQAGAPDGETIILTHGWSMDSTIWNYAKRDLGQQFRVVSWDLPGLGKSRGEISLEAFAADLAAVITWTGATRVVLVGHSIGGMTIQTLARDHAGVFDTKVAGVVLVNTTYTNPLKTMILPRLMQALRFPVLEPLMKLTKWLLPVSQLSAWQSYLSGTAHMANRLGFGKYVTRSQLDHTTLLSTRNSQAAIADGNLAMFRWDATGATAKLQVPVLVLAGEVDIVTKPVASETIAGYTPTATLRKIEGVNHMGFLERSDVYNPAIAEFAAAALATGRTGSQTTPSFG
ncbi:MULTISPECIES: alpha/beta hydrolase [unclassified Devosia]|uniref:alpha/beta fold hydrolase n=1 Tax=unclassified Devosia TaxID=196773 RepID=UPI00155559D5|nr:MULTISPECIES: alpha/beta hydrolase [unclassified Devosia]